MRYHAFVLPFPPSLNRYWRATMIGGFARNILSRDGRAYKDRCVKVIQRACVERGLIPLSNGCLFAGKVKVKLSISAPSKRKCDLDNYLKATFDALTAAKVWEDDSLVDGFEVVRGPIVKGGALHIEIYDA